MLYVFDFKWHCCGSFALSLFLFPFQLVHINQTISKIYIDDWSFYATIEMCVLTEQYRKNGLLCEIYIHIQTDNTVDHVHNEYILNLSINTLAISKNCNCLMWSWNAFNKILIWLIYWVFMHRKHRYAFYFKMWIL